MLNKHCSCARKQLRHVPGARREETCDHGLSKGHRRKKVMIDNKKIKNGACRPSRRGLQQ